MKKKDKKNNVAFRQDIRDSVDSILQDPKYEPAWDWLDAQTYKSALLDDFIISIQESSEQLKAVLDLLFILKEKRLIK
jgi:hypothetical protein